MDLKITDPEASQSEVGADLFMQFTKKAHLAQDQIYALIADIKGIPIEEAADADLVEFISELTNTPGLASFFDFVARSAALGSPNSSGKRMG
jgi:hypothetical protein